MMPIKYKLYQASSVSVKMQDKLITGNHKYRSIGHAMVAESETNSLNVEHLILYPYSKLFKLHSEAKGKQI